MSYKNDSLLYTISDGISLYRESSMTARDADKPGTAAATREKKPGCFLCVLDPHPCTEMQLEGRIVAAREYITNGEKTPVITLDCGTFVVSLAHLSSLSTKVGRCGAIKPTLIPWSCWNQIRC